MNVGVFESSIRGRDDTMVARPLGVTLLSAFFFFGTSMALLSLVALSFPDTFLESVWRLNPEARAAFHRMGEWSLLLMATDRCSNRRRHDLLSVNPSRARSLRIACRGKGRTLDSYAHQLLEPGRIAGMILAR